MDPYKILGVSPNATDDEVKTAYRNLAKKYHPDNYANNPLADLATEKMKEINEAYDEIQKMRKGGSTGSTGGQSYGGSAYTNSGYSSSNYQDIRNFLNMGRINEASAALNRVPASSRDGEWHFLIGITYYKSGWINQAMQELNAACAMEPSNAEFSEARSRVQSQMNGNYRAGNPYGGYGNAGAPQEGCNGCDLCSSLICADCLCNGCGGGC